LTLPLLALSSLSTEEPFLPYLPQFTTLVWNNLMRTTDKPKQDIIVTSSIRFLSSLVQKPMHRALFQEDATLRQIISKIVIPNLMLREVDEERFEDDPEEFIATDLEGGDSDSRRKRSQELLKAMCRQFEAECTTICSEHVSTMLAEYGADPANMWTKKDAAIHLMFGTSIRAESSLGVSQVNENVDVMSFFTTQIFPELQEPNMTTRPMLKATSLKFVSTFRRQFTTEQLVSLMPLLMAHLGSPTVVVHTYAAYSIEKILTAKDGQPGHGMKAKFGPEQLKPFLEQLFTALFQIVDNDELTDNAYAMKCVMRALNVGHRDLMPIMQIVLEKLTTALIRVAKNPRNPQYNHYIFESIAIITRAVCSKDPNAIASFESALFPPFQTILQQDVSEFTPYVFQVFAQLLEYRPRGAGLGDAYMMLFQPLLHRDLWERKGNIPALTRLLCAYMGNSGEEIAKMGHLDAVLGIFQKLISSRANEAYGFDLLSSILLHVPPAALQQYLRVIFQVILTRLQNSPSSKLSGLASHFFALLVGKYGSQSYFDKLNEMQNGLGVNLLAQIWLPALKDNLPARLEAKVQVVGLSRIVADSPLLLQDPTGLKAWAQTVEIVVSILTSSDSSSFSTLHVDDVDEAADAFDVTYDSAYSSLQFAGKSKEDPFPDVTDPAMAFIQALHAACSSQPGRLLPVIQEGLSADPKLSAGLDTMLSKAGVTLM
jgi:exportin-2 (importin alpha re-exporter)